MSEPEETVRKDFVWNEGWSWRGAHKSFWREVHSYKDACGENPFAELAGFAMSMLVLPYSNAEVERTFSQLNVVKSKLRNKLKPETTNAILVVRAGLKRHQKSCFDYELPAAVSAIGTSAMYVQPSHLSGPSTSTSGPVEMVSDGNSGDEDLDVFFVDLDLLDMNRWRGLSRQPVGSAVLRVPRRHQERVCVPCRTMVAPDATSARRGKIKVGREEEVGGDELGTKQEGRRRREVQMAEEESPGHSDAALACRGVVIRAVHVLETDSHRE
ncbi:hypothetical protein MRX96_012600 [Rhipicephalus microplus]